MSDHNLLERLERLENQVEVLAGRLQDTEDWVIKHKPIEDFKRRPAISKTLISAAGSLAIGAIVLMALPFSFSVRGSQFQSQGLTPAALGMLLTAAGFGVASEAKKGA